MFDKCAEVFCQNFENFSIVCTQCDLKTLLFHEFVSHYKEVHCVSTLTIKCEKEEEISIPEESETVLNLHEEPIEFTYSNDIKNNSPVKTECSFEQYQVNDKFNSSKSELDFEDDDDVPLQKLLENPLESSQHTCPECGKLLSSRKSLRMHIKRRHPNCKLPRLNAVPSTTTCLDCNKTYSSRKGLQRHKRESHCNKEKETELLQCPNCEKKFMTRERLSGHLRCVHKIKKDGKDTKTFPCTQCDKVFSERYNLKRHELRHSGVKNFICTESGCSMAFFDVKGLNAHKRYVHIGIKQFVCEQCGFSTKTASSLQTHIRVHTKEKPYPCPICGKCFTTSAAVIEHKVVHTSHVHRPYVCDVCGKTFARQKALYHHKPLHLGIKKFVCKICGKAYAQQAGLSAHKRQHMLDNFGESL